MSFSLFTNSSDGISFESEFGFKNQDRKIENTARTRSAAHFVFQFGEYRRWRIPIRYVNSVTKQTINTWWRDNTKLFFFDDNNPTPSATYAVRITNKSTPIDSPEPPYDYEWKGVIELEEY